MAELKPHQAKQKPVSYLTKKSNKKLFNLNKNIPKNRLIILCGEKTKKQTSKQTKQSKANQTKPNQTNSVKLRQGWSSKDLALQFGAWTQLGSRLQVLIFPMRVLGGMKQWNYSLMDFEIVKIQQVAQWFLLMDTLPKTNMTMENQPFEDVSPIRNGDSDFPFVMLAFGSVIHPMLCCIVQHLNLFCLQGAEFWGWTTELPSCIWFVATHNRTSTKRRRV